MSCYNLLIDQVSLPVVFINFLIYFIDIHIFWYWNHVFISFILQGSNKSFSNNKFSFVLPYKLNAFLLHFFLVLISLICWKIRCFYLPTFCLTVCYYYVTYEFQSESTLYGLPKCQATSCSKHAPYLTFKWQECDSNKQPLSS